MCRLQSLSPKEDRTGFPLARCFPLPLLRQNEEEPATETKGDKGDTEEEAEDKRRYRMCKMNGGKKRKINLEI